MRQFALRQFGGGSSADEIDLVGLSIFDQSQQCSLNSHYAMKGRGARYNGVPKQIMIVDQTTSINSGDLTTEVETLIVMVRRYGTSAVERPAAGDTLVLENDGGVNEKRYRLVEMPSEAFSHLEWELRFSRTKTRHRGGQSMLPYGVN